MTIIDITRPLHTGMAVWPGDTEYQFRLETTIGETSPVNIGAVHMSTHTGTHVDAPYHFKTDSPKMEQLPLDPFIGEALVIHLPHIDQIDVPHLLEWDLSAVDRLLIRTDAWDVKAEFPEHVPTLTAEAVQFLAAQQIQLLGIDVPSVDPIDSKQLENHHLLHQNSIQILEGLDLHDVQEDVYELIALPLNIQGGDGSPVRAILRTL